MLSSDSDSMTLWRGKPMVPQGYDDLASLVKLARKARGRIVEFDWVFTQDDLMRLRSAVHEWGTNVVGRYKCFDARVLTAINTALGDVDTVLVLKEPKGSEGTDCTVSCDSEGELFRLRGHAPFDIVFGYGRAGVRQDPIVALRLGSALQMQLAKTVGTLGWDLQLLNQERFRDVRNALYGNPLSFTSVTNLKVPPGPTVDVPVHFQGPFSAVGDDDCRCLFTNEIAKGVGVYLWTIRVEGEERPWYVGQTRRGFAQRMGEHLRNFLSGEYSASDAKAISRGENRRAAPHLDADWPERLPAFLENYETLIPNVIQLIRNLHFYTASLKGRDAHTYNRVEGAIGRYYKVHPLRHLRDFLSPDLRVPAAIAYDYPIRLTLSSETPIAGLPAEIME